nr:hypothetical protein Iba_chr02fCG3500 [Ipomoea batatas]
MLNSLLLLTSRGANHCHLHSKSLPKLNRQVAQPSKTHNANAHPCLVKSIVFQGAISVHDRADRAVLGVHDRADRAVLGFSPLGFTHAALRTSRTSQLSRKSPTLKSDLSSSPTGWCWPSLGIVGDDECQR